MKWRGRRTSERIEDRRGGGSLGHRAGRGMKISGLGVVIVIVGAWFFGVDPTLLLSLLDDTAPREPARSTPAGPNVIDDQTEEFVGVVLADTEEVWQAIFAGMDRTYAKPSLVLFSGAVQSACGTASAAVGPFYCPGDRKVYLDTAFFQTLAQQLGARGDFAAAYVIAHEVGHHVQNELGILPEVNAIRRQVSETEANRLSVRVELQADCFAGVWARQADERFAVIEPGDLDEAMNAASRIGDDALQRRGQGVVVPDSFTHGTSEQRVHWFQRGFETGAPESCDTFASDSDR